jgi:hypothetical protein
MIIGSLGAARAGGYDICPRCLDPDATTPEPATVTRAVDRPRAPRVVSPLRRPGLPPAL